MKNSTNGWSTRVSNHLKETTISHLGGAAVFVVKFGKLQGAKHHGQIK